MNRRGLVVIAAATLCAAGCGSVPAGTTVATRTASRPPVPVEPRRVDSQRPTVEREHDHTMRAWRAALAAAAACERLPEGADRARCHGAIDVESGVALTAFLGDAMEAAPRPACRQALRRAGAAAEAAGDAIDDLGSAGAEPAVSAGALAARRQAAERALDAYAAEWDAAFTTCAA